MILGLVLPMFLMLVMALFGIRGYYAAMKDSDRVVTQRVRESNEAHAQAVAANVAREMEQYFHAVETVTNDPQFVRDFELAVTQLDELSRTLSDPDLPEVQRTELRKQFLEHSARVALQSEIQAVMQNPEFPPAASWITTDRRGMHVADEFAIPLTPERSPIGKNYAWRTYFTGLEMDLPRDHRPPPDVHVRGTFLSPVFQSTATFTWKVAISRPVMKYNSQTQKYEFLGVVGVTVEMGSFTRSSLASGARRQQSQRHTVLVGGRARLGVILQHPLFDEVLEKESKLPEEFSDSRYHVRLDKDLGIQSSSDDRIYRDPLGRAPGGEEFDRDWIAATVPVKIEHGPRDTNGNGHALDTGLIVLVQEDYQAAIEPIHQLGQRLVREGVVALTLVLVVIFSLWFFVVRILGGGSLSASRPGPPVRSELSPESMPTLAAAKKVSDAKM